MASLTELVRACTDMADEDLDHLHALVAGWSLLADLSFADLLLCLPLGGGEEFAVVAQVRPATGPTVYREDMVTRRLLRQGLRKAWEEGRIVREGDPEWQQQTPVRMEAIPVRSRGAVVALLARDTNLATTRSPSALELTYLRTAGDLAVMVAEGSFPLPGGPVEPAEAPRVGDGLLRLDRDGRVTYASPNALSAYRRLGLTGDVTGEVLHEVHAALLHRSGAVAGGPAAPAAMGSDTAGVAASWERQRAEVHELDAAGTVVLLRALPLLVGDGGETLVLLRDVTEVRRREAQLLSKDATIREIHHRVKNNLQTVAALLRLQERRVSEPEAQLALRESVRRVTSIALVHETLSQTLGEEVAFDEVADQLIVMTLDVAVTDVRPDTRRTGSFGVLPGLLATPLALVLSELLQNAVEHGRAREVELLVERDATTLLVIVSDDGSGLPSSFSLESSDRLGLQIVRTLVVGEMRGALELAQRASGGTTVRLSLPLSERSTRRDGAEAGTGS